MDKETLKPYLDAYCQLLEQKHPWGPILSWTTKNFEELSGAILAETHIYLSTTTIKRALGRIPYVGIPYVTTLNALAAYLGYKHWVDFCAQTPLAQASLQVQDKLPESAPPQVSLARRYAVSRRALGIVFALIALLAIGGFWALTKTPSKANTYTLDCSNRYAAQAPHTAFFKVTVPAHNRNKLVYISYGDQQSFMQKLTLDGGGHASTSHVFNKPGLYPVKIFEDDKLRAFCPILVCSNGWEILYKDSSTRDSLCGFIPAGHALAPRLGLVDSLQKSGKQNFSLVYRNFNHFSLDGDNFILEMRVNNALARAIGQDPTLFMQIKFEQGNHVLSFMKQGATQHSFNRFNDVVLPNGPEKAPFQQDFGRERLLKFVSKNKLVQLYLDGRPIYQGAYQNPVGELRGLLIRFHGIGEVGYLALRDAEGNVVYRLGR